MQGPSENDDTPSSVLKEGFKIHHQEQLPRNRAAYIFSRVRPTACPRKSKVLERVTTFKNVVCGYASRQGGEVMPCGILREAFGRFPQNPALGNPFFKGWFSVHLMALSHYALLCGCLAMRVTLHKNQGPPFLAVLSSNVP